MPKRTALASIEWTDGRAVIKDIICPADDDVIVKAIEQADKTGIDCPLGWPAAFTDFVAAHHAGHVSIPRTAAELAGAVNSPCAARTSSSETRYPSCR